MHLISKSELAIRSDVELAVLFSVAVQALGWTKPGTPEKDRVIASLQNISRASAYRHKQNRVPGF